MITQIDKRHEKEKQSNNNYSSCIRVLRAFGAQLLDASSTALVVLICFIAIIMDSGVRCSLRSHRLWVCLCRAFVVFICFIELIEDGCR